ncbi:MAG: uracil-DNA glycosylase [Candidatus Aminicenantes bacterium]
MENKAKKFLADLEERVKFFSQIGVEFIAQDSPFFSLKQTILNCQKCALSQARQNAVPGEGSIKAELMFVGEAPGRDEDIQGRPFVGRAGQLLTKIINAMKFQREDVYITNVVKCRPPDNRNPFQEEMQSCREYLLRQIDLINPKVIVTLGRVAAGFCLQSKLSMTALRGNFYDFQGIKVMPTFHPSYLIRNEGNRILRKMVWEDMQKVMVFLGKK